MNSAASRIVLVAILFCLFFSFGCEELTDSVNNSTKQTKSFSEDLKPGIPLKAGMDGACTPLPISFDTLLSSVSVWDDVKDHISEVNITALDYSVDPNKNASDGKVYIYITTDSGDYFNGNGNPPEDEMIATTDTIEAETVYELEPMQYTGDGHNRLEELLLDFEQEFYICARWTGNKDDVDMTFLMTVTVDVVFVPLS